MLEDIRTSCAVVMERAAWVAIDTERLPAYAAAFTPAERQDPIDAAPEHPDPAPDREPGGERAPGNDIEGRTALVLALAAINFGSGYHPVVRKRPGCSGAVTMATALQEWAAHEGPVTAPQLVALTPDDAHQIFDQPHDDGPVAELMTLFAQALNDLGALVGPEGSFVAFVETAEGSADRLVQLMDALPFFRDRAMHGGHEVLFYKRAQLAAADLARELHGQGPGRFADLDRLTAFADNLVPHVLRVDGVVRFAPELVARVDREELLAPGSAEEVEIRAAGVHAVELLRAELATQGHRVRSSRLDEVLWLRGGAPGYKARPRHRCRCVFY